jgi:hypothetical protein
MDWIATVFGTPPCLVLPVRPRGGDGCLPVVPVPPPVAPLLAVVFAVGFSLFLLPGWCCIIWSPPVGVPRSRCVKAKTASASSSDTLGLVVSLLFFMVACDDAVVFAFVACFVPMCRHFAKSFKAVWTLPRFCSVSDTAQRRLFYFNVDGRPVRESGQNICCSDECSLVFHFLNCVQTNVLPTSSPLSQTCIMTSGPPGQV